MADDEDEGGFDEDDMRLQWIEKHTEPAFKHVAADRFKQRFEDEAFLYVYIFMRFDRATAALNLLLA